MPSEMVSICGLYVVCCKQTIRLGNKACFVFFGALKLFFLYFFVFYLRSVGYMTSYKLNFQN